MTLATARRISEIVARLDALNGELGKLGVNPDHARRVSAKVKENLAFARALRGLNSHVRRQIVKKKSEIGLPEAIKEAEHLKAATN